MNAREKKARSKRANEELEFAMGPDGHARNERGRLTVHALREISTCLICGGAGFRMPTLSCVRDSRGRRRSSVHAHIDCYLAEYGEEATLKLPRDELMKCSLRQVGIDFMKKIMDLPKRAT